MILGYSSVLINDTYVSLPPAAPAGTVAYAVNVAKHYLYNGTVWREIADISQLNSALSSLAPVAITGNYNDLTDKPSIPVAQIQSDWNQVNTGSADFIKNKPSISSGTVTSVGVTSSDMDVTGSPVTSSGNITANLKSSGASAGTYKKVTVTNKGIITAGVNPTVNNTVVRSLNANFTISTTQDADVIYTVRIAYNVTALLGSTGAISLQYSTNSGTTWTTLATISNNINLGVVLSGYNDFILAGRVPANALVRLNSTTTNATNTYQTGQETLL